MRVGIAQIKLYTDPHENMISIFKNIKLASKDKIDILCFPECSTSGYGHNLKNLNKNEIAKMINMIHIKAIKYRVNVIVGTPYYEKDNIFNSALVLLIDGKKYIYHKMNLTSYDKDYFKIGNMPLIFEIDGVRFGILICRDSNDPALSKKYGSLGVDAIFILSAHFYEPVEASWKKDKNRALPIVRAVENNFFVIKANALGSIGNKISLGGSIIVDPNGAVISECDGINENLVSYDLNRRLKN